MIGAWELTELSCKLSLLNSHLLSSSFHQAFTLLIRLLDHTVHLIFFSNHKLAHNLMLFRSLDLELILKKSPLLIQEMINCISQLFYYHKADAGECL